MLLPLRLSTKTFVTLNAPAIGITDFPQLTLPVIPITLLAGFEFPVATQIYTVATIIAHFPPPAVAFVAVTILIGFQLAVATLKPVLTGAPLVAEEKFIISAVLIVLTLFRPGIPQTISAKIGYCTAVLTMKIKVTDSIITLFSGTQSSVPTGRNATAIHTTQCVTGAVIEAFFTLFHGAI